MLVGAWQSEQFFIALAGTYQQADSRRLCLLSWWGGRRDESDGVVTRKALGSLEGVHTSRAPPTPPPAGPKLESALCFLLLSGSAWLGLDWWHERH